MTEVYEFDSLGALRDFLNRFERIDLNQVKCPVRLYWDTVNEDQYNEEHQVILVTSEAE